MTPWSRLPPAGAPIPLRTCLAALRAPEPARTLCEALPALLDGQSVQLFASGREALRVALGHLAAQHGRREVLVPAYTCFSVPSVVVAAGLRVRLVDVDCEGRIDAADLARMPLERAAALVVCNLFGLPEPLEPLRALTGAAGCAVVDDAAQALGARDAGARAVGARAEVGVLSFGRGKPLAALGGGALAWREAPEALAAPERRAPGRLRGALRALAYDLARTPWLFARLSAVPGLGIGETRFEPRFARGGIDGAAAALAGALLGDLRAGFEQQRRRAQALAADIAERSRFVPLLGQAGSEPVFPRLALLATDAATRRAALETLAPLGASGMYPSALGAVAPLQAHLEGEREQPGARALAARLFTLPTHRGMDARRREQTVERLAALAPR